MLTYQRIRAQGHFESRNGEVLGVPNLTVDIEQLGSGRIFLKTADAAVGMALSFREGMSFVGHTSDGLPIRTSDLTNSGRRSGRVCADAHRVTIGDVSGVYSSFEMAITNLDFGIRRPQEFCFEVSSDESPVSIQIIPVENFDDLILHSKQTACPAVTAQLRLTPGNLSMENLDSLSNDLCTALSLGPCQVPSVNP